MTLSLFSKTDTHGISGGGGGGGGGGPTLMEEFGLYTKIEDYQRGNTTFFPTTFTDSAGQANSVYGQLARATWYRGTMYPVNWGEVESGVSGGIYDFSEIQTIMNTVRDLFTISGRNSAKNKKVMILLPTKVFNYGAIANILPSYLQGVNGSYPGETATRYHYAWAFRSASGTEGYHLKYANFRPGLTGNDTAGNPIYYLRDRFYAFVTALYNNFKNHPAFAGICLTEPIPLGSIDTNATPDYNRNQHFDGRLQSLKGMKGIMTHHMLLEATNFDLTYVDDMTRNNAPDGHDVNAIGFTSPNFHCGADLRSIYNAADFLFGRVVVCQQAQPFDLATKSGQTRRTGPANDIYDWKPDRPNHGNPRTQIENPGWADGAWTAADYDPPDLAWLIERAIYLKSNIFIIQHNYSTSGPNGSPVYNWTQIYNDMNSNTTIISDNTGELIQNDPYCGMFPEKPLKVASAID